MTASSFVFAITGRCLCVCAILSWSCLSGMAAPPGTGGHEQHKAAGKGSPQEEAFVSWARENAVPFQLASPHITGAERAAIDAIVGDSRVVALGESAHGVHEPLAFRNRLFRFLVEERGFTAIFLETGFTEARLLNNYVLGGPGDADDVSRRGFTWGFGRATENLELIQWLRAHNEKTRQKVRVYGIDLTGGSDAGEMQSAGLTLDAPLALMKKSKIELPGRTQRSLEAFLPRFSQKAYLSFSASERAQFHKMLRDLAQVIDRRRTQLIGASSLDDYDFARRDMVVALQLEKMFSVLPAEEPDGGLSPEFYRPATVRDTAMAANVMWALHKEGRRGRVMVFAHNAHILNSSLRGGLWSVYTKPAVVMGQHLRKMLPNSLRIIVTSSARSQADSGGPGSKRGSVDLAMSATNQGAFILNARALESTLNEKNWLRSPQTLSANLTSETLLIPISAFDAIVHLPPLSPSRSIPE